MMHSIKPVIRLCSQSDLPKLQATMPSNNHERRFNKQQAGTAEYLIAWADGRPAGFFVLDWQGQQYLPGVPEISSGEVRSDLLSRGIGTALIKECERRAKQHGAEQICLLVTHDNPNARRLYERLGYHDSGLRDVVTEYTDTNAAGETKHFREECALLVKDLP